MRQPAADILLLLRVRIVSVLAVAVALQRIRKFNPELACCVRANRVCRGARRFSSSQAKEAAACRPRQWGRQTLSFEKQNSMNRTITLY